MPLNLPRGARFLEQLLIPRFAARPPDYVVGGDNPEGAYLNRWYLTPWRRWQARLGRRAEANPTTWNLLSARLARLLPNLYLHLFLRDDDDRALHDHPAWGVSLLLRGTYIEHTIAGGGIHFRRRYSAGSLRFLPAGGQGAKGKAHRIELTRQEYLRAECQDGVVRLVPRQGEPLPCWTLFLFGPVTREWGFHCPEQGWIPWREFTRPGAPGEVGRGCDT